MVSSPLTSTTIFWPLGVQQSGFCYGWREPSCCVAGVLHADTEEEATSALEVACTAPAWRALQASCGGNPEILGYCQYKLWDDSFDISMWKPQAVIIYYHRHPLTSLRFYAFDASIFISVYSQSRNRASQAYTQIQGWDSTRLTWLNSESALNQVTLNQFNTSTLLEAAMTDPSARMLPATAIVLFSISAITTVLAQPVNAFSHLVQAIVKLPVAPTYTLKDICAIAQQFEVRIEQAEYFIIEIPHLRNRGESDITNYAVRYTHFFNTIWMILNDVTIGITFGSFLTENAPTLAQLMNKLLHKYLAHDIILALRWLDSWPAGLKLNTELSQFYFHIFVGSIQLWEKGLEQVTPFSTSIIYVLGGLSTFGGISLVFSAIIDLVVISTIHIYGCYFFTGLIYHRMLRTAGSLFNLFRGKRYNVLRNRVDSWEYDMDHLLFGTMLFTLLAFLFPTVLVYYALFALARFIILLLLATMEFLLTLVNHFPLFALMLNVKDSWRLPGGIYFRPKMLKKKPGSVTRTSLIVENQAVPLSLLFFQYVELSQALARHYNPLRLVLCLLKGEYLAAIPRYEMAYSTRQSVQP